MVIPLETGAFTAALKSLNVKPDVIDSIVSTLTSASGELQGQEFAAAAHVPIPTFGDRATARSFGNHYQKAQEVMQLTIDGMAEDLMSFATNAKTAIAYVNEADTDGAVDLNQAQNAVEELAVINTNSQADANYDEGRNGGGQGG